MQGFSVNDMYIFYLCFIKIHFPCNMLYSDERMGNR
jgi:hypothetical protein